MTHEEKIKFMQIACNMAGYNFTEELLDMITSLNDLVLKHKGKTDLEMVCKIEDEVRKRANIKSKSELLDKFSKKIV